MSNLYIMSTAPKHMSVSAYLKLFELQESAKTKARRLERNQRKKDRKEARLLKKMRKKYGKKQKAVKKRSAEEDGKEEEKKCEAQVGTKKGKKRSREAELTREKNKRYPNMGVYPPMTAYEQAREKKNAPGLAINTLMFFVPNKNRPELYDLMDTDFFGMNSILRIGKTDYHMSVSLENSDQRLGRGALEFYIEKEDVEFFRYEDIPQEEIKQQRVDYLRRSGKQLPQWYLDRDDEEKRLVDEEAKRVESLTDGDINAASITCRSTRRLGESGGNRQRPLPPYVPDVIGDLIGETFHIPHPSLADRIRGPEKTPSKRKPFVERLVIGLKNKPTIYKECETVYPTGQLNTVRMIVIEFRRSNDMLKTKPGKFLRKVTRRGIMKDYSRDLPSHRTYEYILSSIWDTRSKNYALSEKTDCEHCGMKRQNRFAKIHAEFECAARLVPCFHCSGFITYEDLDKHRGECPKYPVLCPNNCRTRDLDRTNIDAHLPHCPVIEIDCRYKISGCNVKIKRERMVEHCKEKAAEHLAMLESSMKGPLAEAQKELAKYKTMAKELMCNISPDVLYKRPDPDIGDELTQGELVDFVYQWYAEKPERFGKATMFDIRRALEAKYGITFTDWLDRIKNAVLAACKRHLFNSAYEMWANLVKPVATVVPNTNQHDLISNNLAKKFSVDERRWVKLLCDAIQSSNKKYRSASLTDEDLTKTFFEWLHVKENNTIKFMFVDINHEIIQTFLLKEYGFLVPLEPEEAQQRITDTYIAARAHLLSDILYTVLKEQKKETMTYDEAKIHLEAVYKSGMENWADDLNDALTHVLERIKKETAVDADEQPVE